MWGGRVGLDPLCSGVALDIWRLFFAQVVILRARKRP